MEVPGGKHQGDGAFINIFEIMEEKKKEGGSDNGGAQEGVENTVNNSGADYEQERSSLQRSGAGGENAANASGSSLSSTIVTTTTTPSSSSTVKRRKKKPYPVAINLSNCKYEVVRDVVRSLNWVEVGDEDEWEVYWTDTSITIDRILRLNRCQKVNRFVGMLEICRKKPLARNMGRMAKVFPSGEYAFVPKSFTLPMQRSELEAILAGKKKKTFILKPDAGCQGKGIVMVQTVAQLNRAMKQIEGDVVAQRYIHKPLLINGFKFDLRIYLLVVSCRPLRMFIYKDGLARFCTEKYKSPNPENLHEVCMHLTNYAVNKKNEKFEFNDDAANTDEGSKWTLSGFRDWCSSNGHDYELLWTKIGKMCVKTIAAIQPHLESQYNTISDAMTKTSGLSSSGRMGSGNGSGVGNVDNGDHGFHCFEMLGLDVLIDHKLEPWLVEVNHSPSLTTDTPLDRQIKESLIRDTLTIVGVDGRFIKKHKKLMKETVKMRLYGDSSRKSKAAHSSGLASTSTRRTMDGNGTSNAAAAAAATAASPSKPVSSPYEDHMAWRVKHEEKHCGRYERIYPVNDETLMAEYERYLDAARSHYAGAAQNRIRETLDRIQAQAKMKLAVAACKEARKKDLLPTSYNTGNYERYGKRPGPVGGGDADGTPRKPSGANGVVSAGGRKDGSNAPLSTSSSALSRLAGLPARVQSARAVWRTINHVNPTPIVPAQITRIERKSRIISRRTVTIGSYDFNDYHGAPGTAAAGGGGGGGGGAERLSRP